MIRQLPKMSLSSYFNSEAALPEGTTDTKIYDVITPSTINNTEGNSMQLQLFQKDSDVNENVRELHGRLTLKTETLPDNQEVKFGFMFSSEEKDGMYDGLVLKTEINNSSNAVATFKHGDVSATEKPDIYSTSDFKAEKQNDWVVLEEHSYASCEGLGQCEISVAFIRNFDTHDKHDIALENGEEQEYNLVGFYRAHDNETGYVSHIGQS